MARAITRGKEFPEIKRKRSRRGERAPEGMFNWALRLEKGYGVKQNRHKALEWRQRAADPGFEPAVKIIETIKKKAVDR